MRVTITDFRRNMKKYCLMVKKESLEITKRGATVFFVESPKTDKTAAMNALAGAAGSDIPYEKILIERLKEL